VNRCRPSAISAGERVGGEDEIEPLPAGEAGDHDAGQHAGGGEHVGEQVPAVGDQRRRAHAPPGADQHGAPDGIDHAGERVGGEALRGGVERARVEPAEIDLAEDGDCRHHDQHADHHGGEILRLGIAIGVGRVGGPGADAEREHGGRGGGDVDDALQRIRIERDAPRQHEGEIFQRQHEDADADIDQGDPCGQGHPRRRPFRYLTGAGRRSPDR